ncbi:MAG: thioredoxin-disulfide reductase [Pseudomonadota bacterium]
MEKVTIIGSGPAGLTAAIYTSRALLNPLLFEGFAAGGQLMTTTEVENFPGFPDGVVGPDLMGLFRKQAERFGTRIVGKDVTKVNFKKRPFAIEVGSEKIETETVIVATGATAKLLGRPEEQRLMGRGVSVCATCDGAFFRNQVVAVVGGGDTAMEEVLFLTRFASKLYLIHRRDQFRASNIMLERVKKNPKIELVLNAVVDEISGEKDVTGLRLKDVKSGKTRQLDATGLFVAIGHQPNTKLFEGHLELSPTGYIVTKNGGTGTSIEGVFAAGDVQDHVYRQAITAAGSGCMAAIEAARYLEERSA